MIHHISIDANNPLHVATVLAEILQGQVYKFFIPGSYIVLPFDPYGTHFVVLKIGDIWMPGRERQSAKICQAVSTKFVASHAAISVPATQQQIEEIGKREGWRVVARINRDAPFSAIEFWLENRTLFELFTPEFASQYLEAMQTKAIEQLLGQVVSGV